jgi:serine protease Do
LTRPALAAEDARVRRFILFFTLLLSSSVCSAQPASREQIDTALAAIYPAVVRIEVVSAAFNAGREWRTEVFGSGTIISPDGYVVTNHHVAGHARRVRCALSTNEEIPADVVGTDALSDLTVLKLHPDNPRTFPAASFGTSASLSRGDPVLALGSPLAISQSVTLGIVSNPEMVMPRAMTSGVSLDGEDVGSIVRWIAHDAAIFPGNSGGPLVDLHGRIVGVNELSYGLSAAIPADIVKGVVKELVERGRVTRGWIGLDVQPRLTAQRQRGALVASVEDNSPAAAADITSGDLITSIAGTLVDVAFDEQVPIVNQAIAALRPGRAATIEFVRNGAVHKVTVTPRERSAARGEPWELAEWGIVVANLTATSARDLGRASVDGVRLLSVRAGGAAQQAKPPLAPDDVIAAIDGAPVASAEDLQKKTAAALVNGAASLLVSIDRRSEHRLSVVELRTPHTDDPPLEARKAWLAIGFQVLTPPLAEHLRVSGRTGVRVTRVIDSTLPLRVGDLIVAVDGTPVRAREPGDEEAFNSMLRQYRPGASVPLTILRDGAEQSVTVPVRTAWPRESEMRRYDDAEFGLRVREMSERDMDEPRLKDAPRGVIVDAVEPGGWAALAQLATGDVVLEIDRQAVPSVDAAAARLKAARQARAKDIVLRVRRGTRTLFVEIEPAWPD